MRKNISETFYSTLEWLLFRMIVPYTLARNDLLRRNYR